MEINKENVLHDFTHMMLDGLINSLGLLGSEELDLYERRFGPIFTEDGTSTRMSLAWDVWKVTDRIRTLP